MITESFSRPNRLRQILLLAALTLCIALALQAPAEAQSDQTSRPTAGATYTVQYGDTLAQIAFLAYGPGEYHQPLCSYNELDSCNILRVGQELRIPTLEELGIEAPPQEPASDEFAEETPAEETPASVAEDTEDSEEESPSESVTPEQDTADPDPAFSAVPEEFRDNLYEVAAGDTLASIALETYNNASLAGRLCVYNILPVCASLDVGIRIFVPVLDELLFGQPMKFLPPVPVTSEELQPEATPDTEADVSPAPEPPAEESASGDGQETPEGTADEPAPDPEPTPVDYPPIPALTLDGDDGELTLMRYIDMSSHLEICAYVLGQSSVPQLLQSEDSYTLLLPSDSAWVAADTALLKSILSASNVLDNTLRSYLVRGEYTFDDLAELESVTAINGRVWNVIQHPDGSIRIGEARITHSAEEPVDGVIHVLSLLQR